MSAIDISIPVTGADTAKDRRRRIIAIVGASSGNLVEWYDFYAYAFTSIYFASAFFPSGDPTSQLLATAGIFAVGFFMRPLGGWLFGWVADRHGRRTSMIISVLMMCAGSLMIAVMPTHATIGALAPFCLLLARLVQGLSVGGEYGTAATYMSEVASQRQSGLLLFVPVRDADRRAVAGPSRACGAPGRPEHRRVQSLGVAHSVRDWGSGGRCRHVSAPFTRRDRVRGDDAP